MPAHDPIVVARLAAELGVGTLTAQILISRGMTDPDAARRFLSPSLEDLFDPFRVTGMRDAVDRLKRAIERKETVLIYGDYDVDGTTSVVILKKAIELAGGVATFHVPHRLKEGYGMRSEVIERAAASGVKLVISVDTGIRSQDVVRFTSELGVDVIITDHHLPDAELPPALAVLNPNRRDCTYPEKNLCGAGVTFKLVQALLSTLGWPQTRLQNMLRSFLKLVAIATVADVVPLLGENRIIVKHGLDGLISVKNRGLKALMEVSHLLDGDPPTAREVAFQIAPRINAAGRMAHAEDVIHLFLTEDAELARTLAQQLHDLNHDRQQTEAEIVRAVLEECILTPVTNDQAALVFSARGWHRGVVGIVASRLVERFCRPVFVLSEEEEEAHGSGRSIPCFHLLDALESMPEIFTRFGGHRQAAGLGLRVDRVEEFRRRLNAYASARLTPEDFRPQILIDAQASLKDLTDDAVAQVLSLAPFGNGNPAPVLASLGTELCGPPNILKDKHIRLRFQQDNRFITATAWNWAERAAEFPHGKAVDVAYCLEEDSYSQKRGYLFWRAMLKDVRPSS